MAKHITILISAELDLLLRVFAAHRNSTKAEAALTAMAAGIPAWVTTSSPGASDITSPPARSPDLAVKGTQSK